MALEGFHRGFREGSIGLSYGLRGFVKGLGASIGVCRVLVRSLANCFAKRVAES